MHKQLAGIAEKEAKLLFLKKNQNLDDYGMEFAIVYRVSSIRNNILIFVLVFSAFFKMIFV